MSKRISTLLKKKVTAATHREDDLSYLLETFLSGGYEEVTADGFLEKFVVVPDELLDLSSDELLPMVIGATLKETVEHKYESGGGYIIEEYVLTNKMHVVVEDSDDGFSSVGSTAFFIKPGSFKQVVKKMTPMYDEAIGG